MVMTSCDHLNQQPPRCHRQNPVESASDISSLTLYGVRDGDNVPRQKITQRLKPWSRPIANSRGLHPQAVEPVLLELAGQGLCPPAMKDLMAKSPKNSLD